MLPRVHIIGVGNVGKFIAHSLAKARMADVTLLLHRDELKQQFQDAGQAITLSPASQKGELNVQVGFSFERSFGPTAYDQDIKNLIVATKAHRMADALISVAHRLTDESDVLLVQNGLGAVTHGVNKLKGRLKTLHGNTAMMPNLYTGIMTHRIYSLSQWNIVHAGLGTLKIGPVVLPNTPPGGQGDPDAVPSCPLFTALKETPGLCCTAWSLREIQKAQLQKLAVNAIINPLTTIFGIRNGGLLLADDRLVEPTDPQVYELLPVLAGEVSKVLTWEAKKWRVPEARELFSPEAILSAVAMVARSTAKNVSSMLQDVRAKRETELQYISGYIHQRALVAGIPCPLNRHLMELIEMKSSGQVSEKLVLRWLAAEPILKQLERSQGSLAKWVPRMRKEKRTEMEKDKGYTYISRAREKAKLLEKDPRGLGLGDEDNDPWGMTTGQMRALIRHNLETIGMPQEVIGIYLRHYRNIRNPIKWKRKLERIVMTRPRYRARRHLLGLDDYDEKNKPLVRRVMEEKK